MYCRSRNTPVGVAAPGRITAHSEAKFGHHQIDRHQDDRHRDHQRSDHRQRRRLLTGKLVDGEPVGSHGIDQQCDQRRDDSHEHRIEQEAQEGEALERLAVILGRKRDAAHRFALIDRDAELLRGIGGIDHLGDEPDAPDLRQLTNRAIGQRHAEQRQLLWLTRYRHLDLCEWQRGGRKFQQRALGLERRHHQPKHRAEHQHDAERQIDVGRDVGPVQRPPLAVATLANQS